MASVNEKGHAVNVANLELLISACAGFDGKYNPSNPNLTVSSLQAFLASAQVTVKDVQVKKAAFDAAANERKVVFDPLKKVCTRVQNALVSSGTKVQTIENARSVNKKIQGTRATPKKAVTATAATEVAIQPKTVSASQQSFDQVVHNFAQFIEIVKSEPLYRPNESDLTISALEAYYTSLISKNSNALVAETALNNARINRNKALYNGQNNILEISKGVKSYVKSIFGATSPEFKSINKISFSAIN